MNMRWPLILVLCALPAWGQWQPSPGHSQIPIWPGTPPDALAAPGPERTAVMNKRMPPAKRWLAVENVTVPTLTVYSPKGVNTGAAAIVFPGGGYQELAIDLEGTEICDWLNSRGITGVLLKYRVPRSGPYWDPPLGRHVTPPAPTALEDAQRAISLVRFHAAEYGIKPGKIGVIGFSAGGHMVAATSTHFAARAYAAVDSADRESCRPDFAIAIYPGHLWSWTPGDNPNFDLNPDIAGRISQRTPPTFLVQAEDDDVDSVNDSLVYYRALIKAGVPVEMHLYARGGHGFGLRPSDLPITGWPKLAEIWLRTIGVVSP